MGYATYQRPDVDTMIFRQSLAALLGFPPSNVFYVSSVTGAATNIGTLPNAPLLTLAAAAAKCTANNGDVVCLMAGHAETLAAATSGVALSTSGVSVVGIGKGRSRPALTCGAGDISGVVLSGSNCLIKNVRIIGSSSQTTTGSACMALTGDDCVFQDCVFEHGAVPLVAVTLSGADRTVFEDCLWLGTAAGPDMGLKIIGTSQWLTVRRCVFNYGTVNVDSAAIGVLASSNCANSIFQDIIILGANSTAIRILGSGAATVPDSLISRVYVTSSVGITAGAAMPFDCGGAALADCFWTDAVASASAWLGAALPPVAGTTTGKAYVLSPGPT